MPGNFERTAEIPYLTWRGHRLINALRDSRNMAEFTEQLIAILEEELAGLKAAADDNGESGPETESLKLLKQEKFMVEMLLDSMAYEMIEGLILNTIGSRVARGEMDGLLLEVDGCSGIYGASPMDKTGKLKSGFSINQLLRILPAADGYLKWKGKVLTKEEMLVEADTIRNIVMIEKSIRCRSQSVFELQSDVVKGIRKLASGKITDKTFDQSFIGQLRSRICHELDATGDVPQLQSPLYVGCARDLSSRMTAHDPLSGMKHSNNPLVLFLSCCDVLQINTEVERFVILKVWEPEQLPVAEKLVIYLSSSMLHGSGLNISQGGNTKSTNGAGHQAFSKAMYQLEIEKPWFRDNLQTSLEVVEKKTAVNNDIIDSLKSRNAAMKARMNQSLGAVDSLRQDHEGYHQELHGIQKAWKSEISELKGMTDAVAKINDDYRMYTSMWELLSADTELMAELERPGRSGKTPERSITPDLGDDGKLNGGGMPETPTRNVEEAFPSTQLSSSPEQYAQIDPFAWVDPERDELEDIESFLNDWSRKRNVEVEEMSSVLDL